MVGIRSFPFGARPIFRGLNAVSFRESNCGWFKGFQVDGIFFQRLADSLIGQALKRYGLLSFLRVHEP